MPLTAPAVTGTPSRLQISMRFIDRSGDFRAVAVNTANTGATDAQIQAMVAAYAAASQANLFSVSIERIYGAAESASAALTGPRDSVYANIVALFKNPTIVPGAVNTFLPAPIPAVMVGSTNSPSLPALETLLDTTEVVLGANWDDVSVRFTKRREKNERIIT